VCARAGGLRLHRSARSWFGLRLLTCSPSPSLPDVSSSSAVLAPVGALAPKGSAGMAVGRSDAPSPADGKDRRRQRLAARAILRDLTHLERVTRCGTPAGAEVRVRGSVGPAGTHAGIAGLQTCGSVWACPVCSAKIGAARTDELDTAIRTWLDPTYRTLTNRPGPGAFALATFTARHEYGDPLAGLWDSMSASWRRLVSSRAYKDAVRDLGVAGYHRTTEVTLTPNGWHVHFHVLYFLDQPAASLTSFATGWAVLGRWTDSVRAVGGSADLAGQDFKVLSGTADALAGVSAYVHKGVYVEQAAGRARGARELAMELRRGDLKVSRKRPGTSRTPFGVLADIVAEVLETGCVETIRKGDPRVTDRAAWSEWEEASRGRRQQVWSRGLRALLCLDAEQSDEDLAAAEVEGADLVVVASSDWEAFASHGPRVAELLDHVERGATLDEQQARCAAFLSAYGVPFTLPAG
jgi:hypothetical protein